MQKINVAVAPTVFFKLSALLSGFLGDQQLVFLYFFNVEHTHFWMVGRLLTRSDCAQRLRYTACLDVGRQVSNISR